MSTQQFERSWISLFAATPLGWRHIHSRDKASSKVRRVIEAACKGDFGD
jgi:hypothetical protein